MIRRTKGSEKEIEKSTSIKGSKWEERGGMTKMLGLGCLLALVAVVSASVLPIRPERKIADADFLKRQKQVLDLFTGVGHNYHYKNEYYNWDFQANFGAFTDEKYPRAFWDTFHSGNFLPRDSAFTMACHHTAHDAIKLFDIFYFAKDFETFIHVANWAKARVNPEMYLLAVFHALVHRPDTQNFALPPIYEIVPNFFVPTKLLHEVIDHRLTGLKEGKFDFNSSGWEYNHHSSMFGGVMNGQRNTVHREHRLSYFTEDVGLTAWFTRWFTRNPSWMCPHKYNRGVRFSERRGENFYYMIQQLFARYTLERLVNGLDFTHILDWNAPIEFGYNPNVMHLNGQSYYLRPDHIVPSKHNVARVQLTEAIERRIWDAIDAGTLWELSDKTLVPLDKENGTEILGRIIYGTTDRPSRRYYKSLYYTGLDALAYIVHTNSDSQFVGNALSSPVTALRDPVFYQYIARILLPFYHFKKSLGPYPKEELVYNGVTIKNVEFDKLLTYFDNFDFEVTNAVPVQDPQEYLNLRYSARQYRFNHKPYHYNVTVQSESAGDAIVRVFIGPKVDADERQLTLEQARMAFFEIDRFPVKLAAGENILERSSTDSPIFLNQDHDSFRSLYQSVNNAESQKEQFYYYEGGRCGMPSRLQLPMGWEGGMEYTVAVVVSPFDRSHMGDERTADIACGGHRLYDGRPFGFPFDRPIRNNQFSHVPNIFLKEVMIDYVEEVSAVNRPAV